MTEDNNYVSLNEFLDYLRLEKGSSEKTIQSYRKDLTIFFEKINKKYTEVVKEDIYKYIENMKEKYKYNSVQRKISSLKSYYKFLYVNKYISTDPTNTVKAMKKKKRLPDILTEEELKKIIDTFNHEAKNVRDRLILELLIATGARISEIVNLEVKDIEDSDYRYIRVLGKGSKYRYIPIYEQIAKKLKEYIYKERLELIENKRDFRLFPRASREQFYKVLKEHSKSCNIEKHVHPHMIRHTVATILLKNGADIRSVQEILGHAGITTTEIYTHVEKSKLKKIYDKIKIGDDNEN
ncbi:site-specific tyrosine recombinase/integron integrase [Sneathia sanguinegens]|uniref:Tyrosine-type recombinase/integrase n=1 Tax=Sneathia sanguinegens TaxID=40543 RepID=A0ABT7HMJ3_9FUSO|nr:site-specific tyrosine recombinase/integron integrase [Sneathia sanguinegens]MDK9581085.1 tyrosine-type recombinase/integrase [Sneathia sanguinegens]